jgi:hypothetical protein
LDAIYISDDENDNQQRTGLPQIQKFYRKVKTLDKRK